MDDFRVSGGLTEDTISALLEEFHVGADELLPVHEHGAELVVRQHTALGHRVVEHFQREAQVVHVGLLRVDQLVDHILRKATTPNMQLSLRRRANDRNASNHGSWGLIIELLRRFSKHNAAFNREVTRRQIIA